MTAPTNDWMDAMSDAIRVRDRAMTGLARWQRALDAAEAEIARLAEQRGVEPVAATPPTEVPVTEEPVTEPVA